MIPPAGANGDGHYAASAVRSSSATAFTLVEMIVVVAVIVVVLGFILPAASTLWNERKNAQAVNAVQGLLMTTRATAMAADGVQSGLLAFVDQDGTQRMVSIAKRHPPATVPPWELQRAYDHIFEITDDREVALPKPMRVVPQYVVETPGPPPDPDTFSGLELANNDFVNPSDNVDQAQRHRNFFTMIFSTDGHLLAGRSVLIQDEDANGDAIGDRTGLRVGTGPPHDDPETMQYYTPAGEEKNIDPNPDPEAIPFLVTDEDGVAINLVSVDGVLVYDDSVFNGVTTSEKRPLLLQTGQPLYVNRWTGAVIKGPIGEAETP